MRQVISSLHNTDTICALSTPPGQGAIAVVRVSGTQAFAVISQIFRPASPKTVIMNAPTHTLHLGWIGDGTEVLDQVVISIYKAPHSYTGEDVVEISCHGSVYIQQKTLELLLDHGLRLAFPGEFTLRAFMQGKLDLSQAEAVADLISCHSGSAHELALHQMRGDFSRKIKGLRERLVEFVSLIELELDFSEEHMEFADRSDLQALVSELSSELKSLLESFRLGNVIKNGIPVAIIGKPNVGKSTLLNAILKEERAIVSEIPGTTRDSIEDTIIIGGYSYRFIDTAGLREAEDKIETIGIEKTWEKINDASVILYVFDATTDSFHDVTEAISEFRELAKDSSKHIVLIGNKTDLLQQLPEGFKEFVDYETIFVSGKRKENIHLIADHLLQIVRNAEISDQHIVSNARHYEALQKANEALVVIKQGLNEAISPDLLSSEIRQVLFHLGQITGEITTDEILNAVFSKFCIGK